MCILRIGFLVCCAVNRPSHVVKVVFNLFSRCARGRVVASYHHLPRNMSQVGLVTGVKVYIKRIQRQVRKRLLVIAGIYVALDARFSGDD